jgi:hypothetical protein
MSSTTPYRMLLGLVVLLGVVASASAQTDYRTKATGMLSVGAGFAGGASLAIEPPDGFKNKPLFAWRLTADATYPLNPTVAAMLSIGLDSRGWRTHVHDEEDAFTDTRISYFTIFPAFRFSAFTLGVNIGFPMSATQTAPDISGNEITEDFSETRMSPFNGTLNTMIEPRLGVVIPVVDEDIGWLGLTLGGGIALDKAFEPNIDSDANFQMVSGHLGFTWQFGIKGTGRR